jgi:hypothetical protein
MAEKRKPDLTMLLRFEGNDKSIKVELFNSLKWRKAFGVTDSFRVRKDGVWWPDGDMKFYKISKVKELIFRGLHKKLRT